MTNQFIDSHEWMVLAARCTAGACPTIYGEPDGDVVVQGYVEPMTTPEGEQAVRVPAQLLRDAVRALDGRAPLPHAGANA